MGYQPSPASGKGDSGICIRVTPCRAGITACTLVAVAGAVDLVAATREPPSSGTTIKNVISAPTAAAADRRAISGKTRHSIPKSLTSRVMRTVRGVDKPTDDLVF